jgi:hypothetical protein
VPLHGVLGDLSLGAARLGFGAGPGDRREGHFHHEVTKTTKSAKEKNVFVILRAFVSS